MLLQLQEYDLKKHHQKSKQSDFGEHQVSYISAFGTYSQKLLDEFDLHVLGKSQHLYTSL